MKERVLAIPPSQEKVRDPSIPAVAAERARIMNVTHTSTQAERAEPRAAARTWDLEAYVEGPRFDARRAAMTRMVTVAAYGALRCNLASPRRVHLLKRLRTFRCSPAGIPPP